jgi:hypothetical protein
MVASLLMFQGPAISAEDLPEWSFILSWQFNLNWRMHQLQLDALGVLAMLCWGTLSWRLAAYG